MVTPYYLANPSPFMGLEKDDPDERPTSPFEPLPDAPPSVRDTKATKIDPFAEDPNDPTYKRLRDLDSRIDSQPRSIGGILAAFSPHGDRTMANLMAQRHLLGNEYHGDQQLKRQILSSQMQQEAAFRRADALERAAQERARAQVGAADIRGNAQVTAGAGHDAASIQNTQARVNRPFPVGAGASVYLPKTDEMTEQNAFRPQADRNAPAAGKSPVNPQVPVIQAELRQLSKALNDPNLTDDQKLPLMRKYNIRMQQLKQMGAQPAPAPSAAPSTAPAVSASGGADNDPLGIR